VVPVKPTADSRIGPQLPGGIIIAVLGIVWTGDPVWAVNDRKKIPAFLWTCWLYRAAYLLRSLNNSRTSSRTTTQSDLILGFEPVRKPLSEQLSAGKISCCGRPFYLQARRAQLSLSTRLLAFLICYRRWCGLDAAVPGADCRPGMFISAAHSRIGSLAFGIAAWCYPLTARTYCGLVSCFLSSCAGCLVPVGS